MKTNTSLYDIVLLEDVRLLLMKKYKDKAEHFLKKIRELTDWFLPSQEEIDVTKGITPAAYLRYAQSEEKNFFEGEFLPKFTDLLIDLLIDLQKHTNNIQMLKLSKYVSDILIDISVIIRDWHLSESDIEHILTEKATNGFRYDAIDGQHFYLGEQTLADD